MSNLRNSGNIVLLSIILGVTGMLSAGILAVVAGVTKKPIDAAQLRKNNLSLKLVLPEFDNLPAEEFIEVEKLKFYPARVGGKLIGIAAEAHTKNGYAGAISGLVGLTPDGAIATLDGGRGAVQITRQNETPGLGTKVCNREKIVTLADLFGTKSNPSDENILPPNAVLDSFSGITAADRPLKITKDGGKIEYITGATISSRAVTDMADNTLAVFNRNQSQILNALNNPETK